MKKLLVLPLLVCLVLPLDARAQGFFGGRPQPEGAINLRRSTTEQYDPVRGQSVAQRPRPDFDPIPVELGAFQFFPGLTIAEYYNTNIYSAQTGPTGDFVTKIAPALAAVSNWGRHAVAFTGVADYNHYLDNGTEDYLGGAMQAEGRYDIARQIWMGVTAGYQRVTEPRASPNTAGAAAEPVQYNRITAGAEAFRGVGRLKVKGKYDYDYYEFDAVKLVGGGRASQSARDRTNNILSGEAAYEYTANIVPFARGQYGVRDYVVNSLRSSTDRMGHVGARMDFGGVTTGEAYIGYRERDYYNFPGGHIGMLDFGGHVLWNVTELTSVQGEMSRGIEETTVAGSSSFINTGGSATLTHELRRNVILEGNLSYSNYDFQNSAREDNIYTAGAGARYFISRNLYADATYDFVKRDSNVAGNDYDAHVFLLRLGIQH